MDELVTVFGNDDGLLVTLRLDAEGSGDPAPSAADLTRGSLHLSVRGQPIWHGDMTSEGFPWTWDELLEFLADAWPHLLWQEGLPMSLPPTRPAAATARALAQWEEMSQQSRDSEEEAFEAFEQTHNLARGVHGAWLPAVWIVREGRTCYVCTDLLVVRRPLQEVITALEELGEALAGRLRSHAAEPRAGLVLKAWDNRLTLPVDQAVAIATSLPKGFIANVQGSRPTEDVWEVREGEFEVNEILAAARMAGDLTPEDVRTLVDEIRRAPLVKSPQLDALGDTALRDHWSAKLEQPFEQGYVLAEWLREQLEVGPQGRVEPRSLLTSWGVVVRSVTLRSPMIDAFACWGPNHGPVVFLNDAGRHNASVGGLHATLAHEVAHLLVDRHAALPLAEVLGGRSAPWAEQRARAFAAELLLPREQAGAEMASTSDPSHSLLKLQRRYLVGQEVAAWQARNSGRNLPPETAEFLRSKVSRPQWY